MTPKIPESIKVAGLDIEVELMSPREAHAGTEFGHFSSPELIIKIDETLPRWKMVDTLLHEVGHAIYFIYKIDDDDKEERIVSVQGTAWTQVFRDNPSLIKFISDTARG